MSMFTADLMPMEIRRPERPEPMNFAYRRAIDPREVSWCRTQEDRNRLFEGLKRHAAAALADHIAKHCKWMDRSSPISPDMLLQLELTIQDRGAYENWLPEERRQGLAEGWDAAMKAASRSLPYGLADAAQDWYE